MKISNNLKTGISAGSQIQLNPIKQLTPEILSPFATTPEKRLEDELKKIDSQFDLYGKNPYGLPQNVGYTELSYKPLTDDEIRQYASDSMAEYKLSAAKQINDSASRAAADLAASRIGLETAAKQKQQEIDAYYNTAKQDSSNDALRRGLARSSIIINKLDALENNKAQAKTDVTQSLFDGIAQIDARLNALETQRLDALDEFDIVYAAKLGQEIAKLQEERQKRLDEVVRYNNSLKADEAKYGLDYAKTDSALDKDVYSRTAEIADKDLITKIQRAIQSEKQDVINSYLYAMTAGDAVKELEARKNFYLEHLGKAAYDRMLVEHKGRK